MAIRSDPDRRAAKPAAAPVITPLIVDPMTIVVIIDRASGYIHAESPSSNPRTPPTSTPKTVLFIGRHPPGTVQQLQDGSVRFQLFQFYGASMTAVEDMLRMSETRW